MKGGWLIKEGNCPDGPHVCPICDEKIRIYHRKHKCGI